MNITSFYIYHWITDQLVEIAFSHEKGPVNFLSSLTLPPPEQVKFFDEGEFIKCSITNFEQTVAVFKDSKTTVSF